MKRNQQNLYGFTAISINRVGRKVREIKDTRASSMLKAHQAIEAELRRKGRKNIRLYPIV